MLVLLNLWQAVGLINFMCARNLTVLKNICFCFVDGNPELHKIKVSKKTYEGISFYSFNRQIFFLLLWIETHNSFRIVKSVTNMPFKYSYMCRRLFLNPINFNSFLSKHGK